MSNHSQVVIETITSEVLEQNPLDDSHIRRVPVYLPPGYNNTEMDYPVVYLLMGFTGRGRFLLNDSAFNETIQERMDRLIASGTVQPMILVLPDCFTRYGGSQYLNSEATGRYEDHLIQELVPTIDQRFRTRAEADYRAIGGKSSGGYGALVQGMKHPDIFGAIACHSGDLYFEYAYKPDFIKFLNATSSNDINSYGELHDFLSQFYPKMHPKPKNFFDIIHISAMGACYSPNEDSPCGFDLPFEFYTGLPRPEVWQRWLEKDPITMVQQEKYAAALRKKRLIFLDCGNRDEYSLHYGARIFSHYLQEQDIPHHYEEFEGGHRHTQYRYDTSLKAISDAFP